MLPNQKRQPHLMGCRLVLDGMVWAMYLNFYVNMH